MICAVLGKPCGEDHQRLWTLLENAPEQFHAVERFQIHPCHDHPDRVFFQDLEGVDRVVTAQDPQVLRSQMMSGPIQEIQIGIDQQEGVFGGIFGHCGRGDSQARGWRKTTTKNRRQGRDRLPVKSCGKRDRKRAAVTLRKR